MCHSLHVLYDFSECLSLLWLLKLYNIHTILSGIMYKTFIRPLLFAFGPETAHRLTFISIKILLRSKMICILQKLSGSKKHAALKRNVFGLNFPNPLGVAAGLDKNAEITGAFSPLGFGFTEIGTVTPVAQAGNPKPRLFRLKDDGALINRMGFNNMGADAIAGRLKQNRPNGIVGGNIGKNTATPNSKAVDDYIFVFNRLYDVVDYFVINVSCPNISNLNELQDKENLSRILYAIRDERKLYANYKPVLLKLSPDLNQAQIDDSIAITKMAGLDGFVIANTTVTRNYLQESNARLKKIGKGGLSGKPVQKRSTEMIAYVHKQTAGNYPIIGVGGIFSAADALEKLKAGASLIQLYTGFIYEGPALTGQINDAIARFDA